MQAPDASPQDIKKAYHRIMRACHPDVVGLEEIEDDEGSAEEVCVFVNDIYEVCFEAERSACLVYIFFMYGDDDMLASIKTGCDSLELQGLF